MLCNRLPYWCRERPLCRSLHVFKFHGKGGEYLNLPQRKLQRFKNYDYSSNGAYFITICTQNRINLFGEIENGIIMLNSFGEIAYDKFSEISQNYPYIKIDKFVIMPNHIHAIMVIEHNGTTQGSFPTLSDYVRKYKMLTTKIYIDGVKFKDYPPFNKKIWQKSFYDHVIRNEIDYQEIWKYIDTNPLKWEEDCLYKE